MNKFKIIDINDKNMDIDQAINLFEKLFGAASVYDPFGEYSKDSDHYVVAVLNKLKKKGHISNFEILENLDEIPYEEGEIY